MSEIETVQNLHPDPRCLKKRSAWEGASSADGEKWRYELNAGVNNGTVFCWAGLTNQYLNGKVLYARVQGTQSLLGNLSVEQASVIVRRDGWVAALAYNPNGNHTITLQRGPFTLCEVGVYTRDDWEKLYDAYQQGVIEYPWVAGPRNATMAGEIGPWEL